MSQTNQPLSVIVDFDGTITLEDIGAIVIKTFGRDGWRAADEAWKRGEISLRELWAAEVNHLRAEDHEAIRKWAAEVAEIRPGFHELVNYCRQNDIPVEIASSGIRFYIDAVLEAAGIDDLPVSAPDVIYDNRGHGQMIFKDGLRDCGMTAMCKCERIWQQRREDRTILFVGDGASDYCAASRLCDGTRRSCTILRRGKARSHPIRELLRGAGHDQRAIRITRHRTTRRVATGP